uniref:EF-hand domain-containing protein n=1 Tax=Chaetoceros debilis TaxID=122233 RepID=A0A7S3QET0_9STRA
MSCCSSKDFSFLRLKLGRYFDQEWVDSPLYKRDGTFSKEHMKYFVDATIKNYEEAGKPLSKEKKRQSRKTFLFMYNIMTLNGIMAKNRERFINHGVRIAGLPGMKTVFRFVLKRWFKAIDVDGDGVISWQEWYFMVLKPFLKPRGVEDEDEAKACVRHCGCRCGIEDEEEAKACFTIVDANKNGTLSFDEVANAT